MTAKSQDRKDLEKCVDELERWRNIGSDLRELDERIRVNGATPQDMSTLREIVEDMPK